MDKENKTNEKKVVIAEQRELDKNHIDKSIKAVIKEAIELKNKKVLYLMAYNFYDEINDETFEEIVDAIIEIGDGKYIYDFAVGFPKAPIDKLAKAIVKSEELQYIIEFAVKVKGAPIEELADAIIKSGNAKAIYKFAFYVDYAPKTKLAEAIIKIGSQEDIEEFAYNVMQTSAEKLMETFSKMPVTDEDELE